MGFNLYFAGFGCKDANPELVKLGGLRLLSYHLDKTIIEWWCNKEENMKKYFAGHVYNDEINAELDTANKLKAYHPYSSADAKRWFGVIDKTIENNKGGCLFLDSGAFSAHTKGAVIDVDQYIAYINEKDEHLACFAQLDTIPGEFGKPKTKEQLEEAPELSWQNYLYMVERVKSPEKLLPIFHMGEDFKHLRRMLEHTPRIDYIGISPANDVSTVQKGYWIDEVFKVIKASSNPDIKTHAFGMTSLPLLEQYPFYSADSTSWLMNGRNGNIMSKYGTLILSANQKSDPDHVMNMPEAFRKELEEYVQQYGYDLQTLSENYKARMIFNIRYLVEWAANYQYKPKTVKQNKLF